VWNIIATVSSGITLAAFLISMIANIYRIESRKKEHLIRIVPENDRAALVEQAMEFFQIDTSSLTNQQKFDIALKQIDARARRFRYTI
jgi:hypothetical protein